MARSIGFRYVKEEDRQLLRILSIGRESIQDGKYAWEGRDREGDGFIFQYTLSGEGSLSMGGQVYRIPTSQAFLVKVPSDHCYFYDSATGEPWEFLWLRFTGPGIDELCNGILNRSGSVLVLQRDTNSIVLLEKLYEDLLHERLADDKYLISLRLYEWVISLLRLFEHGGEQYNESIPKTFRYAAAYMDQHYAEPIQLDELAAYVHLSKHHLCRMFSKYYGFTPIHYLRRRRIQEGCSC